MIIITSSRIPLRTLIHVYLPLFLHDNTYLLLCCPEIIHLKGTKSLISSCCYYYYKVLIIEINQSTFETKSGKNKEVTAAF